MATWMRSGERLRETLVDSLAGFDHVAERAHRFDFYAYCEQYAVRRAELAREFGTILKQHGSKLPSHGTVLGTAHRLFFDIRSAFDAGVIAVLEELLRGETFLASRIDAMLEHDDLPEDVYDIVHLIRTNASQSALDLKAMHSHASKGFPAGSFSLYR